MAIFGRSGVGKTTLMRNMVVADLHNGNGLTVIDPHGLLSKTCSVLSPAIHDGESLYPRSAATVALA